MNFISTHTSGNIYVDMWCPCHGKQYLPHREGRSQCIVFGNVVNPGTFIINGNIVRPEETVKLLGVHIDNKLDVGHHVSHICQKAGKQVKVLSRLSRVLNESNKLLLYSSFISCYFN